MAPSAITASTFEARDFEASGTSKAPGTSITEMLFLLTPKDKSSFVVLSRRLLTIS